MWERESTRREFIKLAAMLTTSFSFGCISDELTKEVKENGKNPKDYPVVVIGAGLGGLSSALYLSKAGFPVTVIEQHNIPGGYATAFRRGDYYFDVSLHFFGIREDIYKELGIGNKVERIPLERTIRIISKDKDVLIEQTNSKEMIEALYKYYPKEKDGIIQYYQHCFDVFEELTKFSKKVETGSISLQSFPSQFPKMWGLRDMSYADFLDKYIKDAETKSSLSRVCAIIGLPPSKASAFMAVVLVGSLLKSKTYYYFRSRSQDFSNALADVIKENNGNLIYGGNGTLPKSNITSLEKPRSFIPLVLSPLTSTITPLWLSAVGSLAISILSPTLTRLPGLTSASQAPLSECRSSNISTKPPVSTFLPYKRAGITRLSLNTRTSPLTR